MKRIFTMLCCCVALLIFGLSVNVSSQSDGSGNVKTTIAPLHALADGSVVPAAGASLVRNNSGVLGSMSTSGLTPGHVITFWWVIYNNPELCAAPICAPPDLNNPAVNGGLQFGAGTVADLGGRASFSGYLGKGDNSGFYLNPIFPNMPNPSAGISDIKKAQIHIAVRSHGFPNADPTILQQQLTSFPGGCSVGPCATLQAAFFLP